MPSFDPSAVEFIRDPYPVYARLREHEPVYWSDIMRGWVLTGYEHVDAVVRDFAGFSSDLRHDPLTAPERRLPGPPILVMLDPPDHTRLRALVTRAFARRAVELLRPRIEALTGELLDAVHGRDAFDVMDALALPLPAIVIAELLGVPSADRDRFKRWSLTLIRSVEPVQTEERLAEGAEAQRMMSEFLAGIMEQRRRAPENDLISELLAVEEAGDRLSPGETMTMVRLLLVGGHETTTDLIGNGLLALLRHPEQMARLRSRPELMASAVEEILRYDAPVQYLRRVALAPFRLGDREIEPGQRVFPMLGAANRDPAVFDRPEQLDIERTPNRHLAFGRGIHHCVGAALARLEAAVALEQVLARFGSISLVEDPPRHRPQIMLRGLETLPVRIS
jgi:hypothetical protein